MSPYALIKKHGYVSLTQFRQAYNKAFKKAGDDMPSSTLSQYETKHLRMSTRRFENFSKFLGLTRAEKNALLLFFDEEKRPLKNVAKKFAQKKKTNLGKKYGKQSKKMLSPYFKGGPRKSSGRKLLKTDPARNAAGNFLILYGERAPRLGKRANDVAVLIALFAEANVKTK